MNRQILTWILRAGGVLTLSALGAVFLPETWMRATHRWLGLGEFPAAPLTDYLTRAISALYAVHGGLLLLVSTNLDRFRPIVVYLGWSNVALGLLLTGIDLHAGLPGWWTWNEGPPLTLLGFVLLYLVRAVPRGT